MIDVGLGWATPTRRSAARERMEEFRPYWIEEPFWPDEYDIYRALAEAVDTPIAAGEEETTLLGLRAPDRRGRRRPSSSPT